METEARRDRQRDVSACSPCCSSFSATPEKQRMRSPQLGSNRRAPFALAFSSACFARDQAKVWPSSLKRFRRAKQVVPPAKLEGFQGRGSPGGPLGATQLRRRSGEAKKRARPFQSCHKVVACIVPILAGSKASRLDQ